MRNARFACFVRVRRSRRRRRVRFLRACVDICGPPRQSSPAKHGEVPADAVLKGIDLTADETLAVWRSQFAHGRFADFQREHRYHVRHAYGLEEDGGLPAAPVRETRQAGDGGGVSLRQGRGGVHVQRTVGLRAELSETVTPERADEIASLAERGAPRAACARYFVATHGGGGGGCGGGGGGGWRRRWRRRRARFRRGGHRASQVPARLLRRERVARGGGAARGAGTGTGGGGDADDASARRHLAIELEGSESETEEENEGIRIRGSARSTS